MGQSYSSYMPASKPSYFCLGAGKTFCYGASHGKIAYTDLAKLEGIALSHWQVENVRRRHIGHPIHSLAGPRCMAADQNSLKARH